MSVFAIYTPAVSTNFAKLGYGVFFRRHLPVTEGELDFLKPGNAFFYPYALYSAGQAATSDLAATEKSIISERDRSRTLVIGDSGGFQVQQGTVKFEGAKTLNRSLRWLEATADRSMIFDFPTGGISAGNLQPHVDRLQQEGHDLAALVSSNGLSTDFNACLLQTKLNNDYFIKHRTHGKTTWMNVIQGRNEAESRAFYDGVKTYDFGAIAFAGVHQSSFSMLLSRIMDLRDEGRWSAIPAVHVLGISILPIAYLFTTILRGLRRFNPDIQLTFDTASPFIAAARWRLITGVTLDKFGWQFRNVSLSRHGSPKDHSLVNELCEKLTPQRTVRRPFHSTPVPRNSLAANSFVGSRLKVSDLCIGSAGTASLLDADSVPPLMSHNVQAYVTALQRVNAIYDDEAQIELVPPKVRAMRVAIEMIFDAADPRKLIVEWGDLLDTFVGAGSNLPDDKGAADE